MFLAVSGLLVLCVNGKGILLQIFVIGILFLLMSISGCTDLDPDHLYAVYLDQAPVAVDWERSLPKRVTVKGGRLNKLDPLPEIDADTVHTSTASCHHGSKLPEPVTIEMRAFYTATDLYLQLSWPDNTRNDQMRSWNFDGTRWLSSADFEDGFGIIWDIDNAYPQFTCSYACHLDDFGVSGQSFRGHNRMKLSKKGPQLDLWNWKAGRTGHLAFADDRYLDERGMHGDLPGELFHPNSLQQVQPQAGTMPFSQDDRPLYDTDGAAIEGQQPTIFSRAPGYLTDRPSGDRADIKALSHWQDGVWTVTLQRKLQTGSPRDVQFKPEEGAEIPFGVSLMDNSLYEHYASTLPLSMVLLPESRPAAALK